MSRLVLVLVAALGAGPWGAAPRAEERPPPSAARPDPAPAMTLDDLFARLAAAKDETEAKGIAGLIERRWARSGSDTADLLTSRALQAMQGKDNALAVELLDRVIALEPRWAEAWHRRAAAFFHLDDPARAIADVRQAIAREPRHYGAWASLGQLYYASDDKKRALEAFKRALALHPYLDSVRTMIERLKPEIEGRDL